MWLCTGNVKTLVLKLWETSSKIVKNYFFISRGAIDPKRRTLNFADIEGWKFDEIEGWKIADTIFLRAGKWPTLFFEGWKIADTYKLEGWKVADKTYTCNK